MTMPKITRFGGHSIGGITDTATGSTERDSGFTEDTDRVRAQAAERLAGDAPDDDPSSGYSYLGDDGEPSGLVAGGDEAPAAGEPPFDPSELSVADVQALLAECSDEEKKLVVEAERKGKNRKGVTGE
jgi:hypothetical protein